MSFHSSRKPRLANGSLRFRGAPLPVHERADRAQELLLIYRLGDELRPPDVQVRYVGLIVLAGRQKEDRDMAQPRVRPDAAAKLEAVRPGKTYIEHHQIGLELVQGAQKGLAVAEGRHVVARQ